MGRTTQGTRRRLAVGVRRTGGRTFRERVRRHRAIETLNTTRHGHRVSSVKASNRRHWGIGTAGRASEPARPMQCGKSEEDPSFFPVVRLRPGPLATTIPPPTLAWARDPLWSIRNPLKTWTRLCPAPIPFRILRPLAFRNPPAPRPRPPAFAPFRQRKRRPPRRRPKSLRGTRSSALRPPRTRRRGPPPDWRSPRKSTHRPWARRSRPRRRGRPARPRRQGSSTRRPASTRGTGMRPRGPRPPVPCRDTRSWAFLGRGAWASCTRRATWRSTGWWPSR